MITAGQGQSVTLEADFYAYDGGPPINLTGITLTIVDPNDVTEVNATPALGITNPSPGIYNYTWAIPTVAPIGVHTATWTGTYNAEPVTAAETIVVSIIGTGTWCTTQDVLNMTSATITSTQLLQAGFLIDIACGRAYAVDGTRVASRDANFLKVACAWQACWMASQPDFFNRIDALDISQGRSRTQLRDTAMFLAPLARKALKRVSWLKSRSIHIQSPFQDGLGVAGINPLSSATDELGPWTPIEGW